MRSLTFAYLYHELAIAVLFSNRLRTRILTLTNSQACTQNLRTYSFRLTLVCFHYAQLAFANPGKIILTAPYSDAGSDITVSTIAVSVYDNENTRLIGVGAVDLTYPPMHSVVFNGTGCRQLQADVDSPACFLFDESGILTTSFRFFDPKFDPVTNKITPIKTVFIGEDEPELAQALIRDGLLSVSSVDDYLQTDQPARRTFPYK